MNDAPKTILVTGPAGFIGGNFVRTWKKRFPTTKIVGIDNFSTGRRDVLDPDIVFYEGSILDTDLLERIFAEHKPEYVFHFAALPQVSYSVEHPAETTAVNLLGTVQLLEKSRDHKVKRLMYSSSAAVYGNAAEIPVKESESTPEPLSPYGLQKLAGEPFCKMFYDLYGLDTAPLRYFNVFGPGQYGDSAYATVVSAWLEALYFPKGNLPYIEGDGTQTRDLIYVGNVVDANIAAALAQGPIGGKPINVAAGRQTSLLEVKAMIEQVTGKPIELEQRPPRVGDIHDSYADTTRAKTLIGYTPTIDLERGLRETVAWFDARLKNGA